MRTNFSAAIVALALAASLVPSAAFGAQKARGGKKPSPGAAAQGTAPTVVDPLPAKNGFDLPPYTRAVLPNGLVVLLMEQREVPVVSMQLTVKSGAADDPAAKSGLAALTADLLTAGTTTRSAQQLADEVDFLGGELTANVDADATTVSSQFLAKDVDAELALVADVVLRPAFAKAEVDRLRQQRLAEIASLPEDARSYANAQFEAAVFANTPYGRPAMGLRKSVESITREDVAAFYAANYAASNSVLAVVGAFETDAMLAKLREAFGAWPRRDVARGAFPAPGKITGRRVILVDYPNLTQTQIRIGAVGVARNDPSYYAIQVANTALGGGFTSRLVDEIRVNRSLSYSAGSVFRARAHPGPYFISTFTKNATTRETIDVALDVLKKFRDQPLPAEELKKAKNYLLGQFPLGFETPDGLASTITAIEVYDLPKNYVETFAANVRALTPEQVTAAIRRYFEYDNIVILVFTNAAETKAQLEGLGPIEAKDQLE